MDDKEIEDEKYDIDSIYIKKILKIKKEFFDYIYNQRDKKNNYPKGLFMDEYILFIKAFKSYKQYKEEEHNEFINFIHYYISSHNKLKNIQKEKLREIINNNT